MPGFVEPMLITARGENKAAIEAARREGRSLDDGKYEIYGLDEETL
jgi:TBC1 domain family member 14